MLDWLAGYTPFMAIIHAKRFAIILPDSQMVGVDGDQTKEPVAFPLYAAVSKLVGWRDPASGG